LAERLRDRFEERPQLWWAVGLGAAIAAGILITLLWWALSGGPSPRADKAVPVRQPLYVSKTAPDTQFRTVNAAVLRARANDRIIVMDEVIEEAFVQLGGYQSRLSLESGVPGKRVKWRLPEKASKEKAKEFLLLSDAPGVVVKDFEFEGRDQVEDLIVVTGSCPGARLEGVVLHGFTRSAVKFYNCEGGPEQPVTLTNLRITTKRETDAGLLFDLSPSIRDPADNQHIVVDDCLLSGPAKDPIHLNYPRLSPTIKLPTGMKVAVLGKN
jgi:hypothetical protein